MQLRFLALPTPLLFLASIASAQCIAVVDEANELPHHLVTANNTGLSYDYDLQREEYRVSVARDGRSVGPYGPFHLSVGCAPALLQWESDRFVLLQGGCGTFCWYVEVLPLQPGVSSLRVERPLAFDASRNLLANYPDQDTIRVRNLSTGAVQEFKTAIGCYMASGLCFEDVRFTADAIEYSWRELEPSTVFAESLSEELLTH